MDTIQNKSKYPIVLVHGIAIKDFKFFKAFGRIEKTLKSANYSVYTANTDGFGTIESNAEQLKAHILKVLETEKTDKVNIIAHSKGGLDSKFMIENCGMECRVASLTTLCTPHKGSPIASFILRFPKWMLKFVAFWVNLAYRIFGDKHPDSMTVCNQLQLHKEEQFIGFSDKVYCQSYSSSLKKSRDDFIMGIPLMFFRKLEKNVSDGLVSTDSAKFENYKGDCIDGSISHSEIVDFMVRKSKKERIYAFYLQLCAELANMGF